MLRVRQASAGLIAAGALAALAGAGLAAAAPASGTLYVTNERSGDLSVIDLATRFQDYGVEAGGPLWADHAWLWGSYGRKEIPLVKLGGANDNTDLDDYSAKLNIQPVESNSATGFYLRGNKLKYGRSAGPRRPAETSVDQTGPTTIWKGDDSQVFGPSFVVNGWPG